MASGQNATTAAEAYSKAMYARGHGLAMWNPSPQFKPVKIGQVGYILGGGFQLLFDAAAPLGERVLGQDVPDDFVPLDVGPIIPMERKPGVEMSSNIRASSLNGELIVDNIPGAVFSAGLKFMVSSSRAEGAILLTRHKTLCQDAQRRKRFKDYIRTHHRSWHRLALNQGHDIRIQDLILTTGCDLTANFSMVTFVANSDNSSNLEFEVGLSGIAMASMSWSDLKRQLPLVHENWGPQDRQRVPPVEIDPESRDRVDFTIPYDQCVFLRGFRIYYRSLIRIPKVLAAQAEPGTPDYDSDSDFANLVPNLPQLQNTVNLEDIGISGFTQFEDPLSIIAREHLDVGSTVGSTSTADNLVILHDDDYYNKFTAQSNRLDFNDLGHQAYDSQHQPDGLLSAERRILSDDSAGSRAHGIDVPQLKGHDTKPEKSQEVVVSYQSFDGLVEDIIESGSKMNVAAARDPRSKEFQDAKRSGNDHRLRLNNLIQTIQGEENLRWEQFQSDPPQTTPWTAIVYLNDTEWGRGTASSLSEAKEAAALVAYRSLYKSVYGPHPQS